MIKLTLGEIMIYLDYSATTPVNDKVLEVFNRVCKEYPANSNSLHNLGIKSKSLEIYATEQIAKMLKVKKNEIIYTSGASESNNLAIKGICQKYQSRGRHIITTKLEHSSIIEPLNYLKKLGFQIDYVKITEDGVVDLDDLKRLIRDDTILVSICLIDSELGIKQPIQEIAQIIKNYPKCYFHVDCTQGYGKIPVDLTNVDLASMSAHKIYGLKGIGLLIKKENIIIEPLIHGGKSTTDYRSGTPALPLIVSLNKALELILPKLSENYQYVKNLNDLIITKLEKYDGVHINSTINSIPHIINFSLDGIKPETFIHALDQHDIYISTKSACSKADSLSNAVYAVTNNQTYANHSLRISISYLTTSEEVEKFLEIFDKCYYQLKI